MSDEIVKIPDIGGGSADIIEICVSAGDTVFEDDALIVLESDKASMDVPAPRSGVITGLLVKVGDSVSEGDDMLKMSSGSATADQTAQKAVQETVANQPEAQSASSERTAEPDQIQAASVVDVTIPYIAADNVPVIEICVAVGSDIAKEDALVVLESDKATMEVPSPFDGIIREICVKEGDQMSEGDLVVKIETVGGAEAAVVQDKAEPVAVAEAAGKEEPEVAEKRAPKAVQPEAPQKSSGIGGTVDVAALEKANHNVHAGPAVRRLAREFGVDLSLLQGSGPRSRILKEDVQAYVKGKLSQDAASTAAPVGGAGIPPVPAQDYARWGDIEEVALNRLRKVAAQNFQRSWLNVSHVTQFDEADITELEAFRKASKSMAEARGTKLTPLPFFLKAVAHVLKELPQFCSSLSEDGQSVIYKKYINIGVAVDTPDGLLVPVIKNVDQKGLWELSEECIELAGKARDKKLKPDEMQGGCFTISSLGSIGGTAFTPIVNAPEVAILGISKAAMKPVWNGQDFDAKLMCPLSLSYDHRVINGADAARFTTMLAHLLSDIRRLLL